MTPRDIQFSRFCFLFSRSFRYISLFLIPLCGNAVSNLHNPGCVCFSIVFLSSVFSDLKNHPSASPVPPSPPLRAKANVNTKTTGGDTALHWACSAEGGDASAEGNFEERSLRSAEVLIGAGADVRAKNDRDERAQDLATDGAVVALLLSATEELHKQEEDEVMINTGQGWGVRAGKERRGGWYT